MTSTVADYLQDRAIMHAIEITRLGNGNAQEVINFISSTVYPDILRRIQNHLSVLPQKPRPEGINSLKSLIKLKEAYEEIIKEGYRQGYRLTTGLLMDTGQMEIDSFANMSTRAFNNFGIDFSLSTPSPGAVSNVVKSRPIEGLLLRQHFNNLGTSLSNGITSQINIGLTNGESSSQILRRVRGVPGVFDGPLLKNNRNIETVVRTATNHTVSEVREETYKANSDIIKKVKYVATLDGRTTIICASLDGKIFPVGEGPRPPMHFNCRSTTVPVFKSYQEFGLKVRKVPGSRSSLSGQVPEDITYPEWLRRQPAAFQDRVLGPTRGKAYRQGKISFDQFVDSRNNTISVKNLRKREGI